MKLTQSATDPTSFIERIRAHDQDAFATVVGAYDRDLLRLAVGICGDKGSAEDAVQETWQKLWRSPPNLRHEEKLRSWLLTVTANITRQRMRRTKAAHRANERLRERQEQGHAVDWAERLDARRLLASLPDADAELLVLHFAVGLSGAEIAEHLGIRPGAVRTRLYRVLARMRKEMVDE